MPADINRKLNIGKGILILLILLHAALSIFDCMQVVDKVWNEALGDYEYIPDKGYNNFSWVLVICAALQVVLILRNSFKLQMIPGIISALPGIVLPLRIFCANLMAQIVYVLPGPVFEPRQMTPNGRIVFVLAVVQIIASIFSASWFSKLKKRFSAEEQNPAEGEELIV